MDCYAAFFCKVKRYVRAVQGVIRKILFDDLLLVPRTNDEFVVTVMRIRLEYMPQKRLPAYFYHGLRPLLALFAYPRP
jgi:hypothetical protein